MYLHYIICINIGVVWHTIRGYSNNYYIKQLPISVGWVQHTLGDCSNQSLVHFLCHNPCMRSVNFALQVNNFFFSITQVYKILGLEDFFKNYVFWCELGFHRNLQPPRTNNCIFASFNTFLSPFSTFFIWIILFHKETLAF